MDFVPGTVIRLYIELVDSKVTERDHTDLLRMRKARRTHEALLYLLELRGYTKEERFRVLDGDRAPRYRELRDGFIKQALQHGFQVKDIASFLRCSGETVRRAR